MPGLIARLLDELDLFGVTTLTKLDAYIAGREAELAGLQRIRAKCGPPSSVAPRAPRRRRLPAPVPAAPANAADDVAAVAEEALPSDLVEWIVERLNVRGPQTVQQLAAAKGTSESLVRRAIGKATRQIVWDDATDKYRLRAA